MAVMLPNIPAMLEAHFGVPMIGAVLNALNVRLDAEAIAFMLAHGEAKVLIADREFHDVVQAAIGMLDHPPLVIDLDDPEYGEGQANSELDYEAFLAEGDPNFAWQWPDDEWQAISLNYTSGTTGNPKGVVYHHRGAYLNSLGNQMTWAMGNHPVYLWTLPMFHCNGWCYPWTVTALAGVHVFLRRVDPQKNPQPDSRASDHPSLRCAHCAQRPGEHARLGQGRDRPSGQCHGCRSGTTGQGDWRRRGNGYQGHPRLRSDRGLRTGDSLRLARGLG
nr:hypothetical protein GCM10020185_85380 [Pseudomonas brassicacearum subsp. brassicacearum]